jgi:HEPN domain-containing protein
MLEPSARLWLNQARSDYRASSRLLDDQDHETYCQAIAKYQQVVEKSVKAIAAAIRDAGISPIYTGFTHEVEKIVSALVLLPRGKGPTDIKDRIKALLNEGHRSEIRALCALAPKRPGPGELARRNTEYPFQRSDGSWIAPHDEGAFDLSDVERFRALATRIIEGSARTVSALERLPRPKP